MSNFVAVVDTGNLGTWRNELLACDKPMGTCLYAWCCPACANASARTEYDTSNFIFNLCSLSLPMGRNIIREGYGIEGTCLGDIFTPCICQPCSTAQVLQEVRLRGAITRQAGQVTDGPTWSHGLFECCGDCGACAYVYFCPNCAMATTRSDFDSSNWLFNCCFLTPCLLRNIIREGYGIEGDCMNDILITCFCGICALTQSLREVRKRGKVTQKAVIVPGVVKMA